MDSGSQEGFKYRIQYNTREIKVDGKVQITKIINRKVKLKEEGSKTGYGNRKLSQLTENTVPVQYINLGLENTYQYPYPVDKKIPVKIRAEKLACESTAAIQRKGQGKGKRYRSITGRKITMAVGQLNARRQDATIFEQFWQQ
jgi:hypothetical protein